MPSWTTSSLKANHRIEENSETAAREQKQKVFLLTQNLLKHYFLSDLKGMRKIQAAKPVAFALHVVFPLEQNCFKKITQWYIFYKDSLP